MTDKIDTIAIVYAMEHDLPAKVVGDYCHMLATAEFNGLAGLKIYHSEPVAAMRKATGGGSFNVTEAPHQTELIKRLRSAGLMR